MTLMIWPIEVFSFKGPKGGQISMNTWAKVDKENVDYNLVFTETVIQGEDADWANSFDKLPKGYSVLGIASFREVESFDLPVDTIEVFLRGSRVINAKLKIIKLSPFTVALTRAKHPEGHESRDIIHLRFREENGQGLLGCEYYGKLYALDTKAEPISASDLRK